MDRAHEPRWPTLLLAVALAAVPLGVAAAIRSLPPLPAEPGGEWIGPAFAAAVAAAAAIATLASLVPALRHGSPRDLLRAGASATLAGGGLALLAGAESIAIPLLAAGAMTVAGELVATRAPAIERPMSRVGGAVGVMVAAEAVAVLTVVPAVSDATESVAAALFAAAAVTWLVAAVLGAGSATIGAALVAAGGLALALDRGTTIDGAVGLAAVAVGQLVSLVGLRDDAVPATDVEERLPDLARRLRDAVLRFDGQLGLREWNDAAADLLALDAASAGIRIDDLLGVSLSELPGDGRTTVSHRGVGALEVAMHRSGGGVLAVIRDPGVAPDADRLGVELRATIEELLRARRTIDLQRGELERSATVDPLTGVASRGAILERLRMEVAQARRYRHSLAVVQLDVDDFAEINARHGINGGDSVLREVALRMRLRVREADALGRCGSDGFLATLPHTDEVGAATFADALRHRLAQRPIRVGEEERRVTVSIGVATMSPGEDLEVDGLLARVQEALDSARSAGGDRIALDRLHGLARIEPREPPADASAEPEAG